MCTCHTDGLEVHDLSGATSDAVVLLVRVEVEVTKLVMLEGLSMDVVVQVTHLGWDTRLLNVK